MKTFQFRRNLMLLSIVSLLSLMSCAKQGFEWQAEAHTKELDRKKGYKKKKHRANYHRYGQHHSKHNR
ncbi:MAG: hypothetical protein NXI20_12780 [bacterium]|nr:hypothetical protein [bacterium]